jgi:ABC-2 type transport system permease protein
MSGFRTMALVAGREIVERLRSRPMWIMTILTAVLLAALIIVPPLVMQRTGPVAVALVGAEAQALEPELSRGAAAARVNLRLVHLAGDAEARVAVSAGTVAAAVELTGDAASITVKRSVAPAVQGLVQAVASQAHERQVLAAAGVPEAVTRSALAPVAVTVRSLQPVPRTNTARVIAALVAGYLLVYSILAYSASVAIGVAQEKTSRTAEVLLATVRPSQLMAGKVLGIGAAGLGQMAIAVAAGLLANTLVKGVEIPGTVARVLPSILIWFVLGYALYAAASAAAGALVSRSEEVGSATAPLQVVLIAALGLVYAVTFRPDTWWTVLLSLLPPFTPVLMPARMAIGLVPWWQVGVGVLVMVAAIILVVRVAARIYASSLVQGGGRISWGAAFVRRRGA